METKRKPYQGVLNIIRFNWHFYLIAAIAMVSFVYISSFYFPSFRIFTISIISIVSIAILSSLIVSYYIYDYSKLYHLDWLPRMEERQVLNVNAGFDEISPLLKNKFPKINLSVCDFFNPNYHTEISIKRARKAYPLDQNAITISTSKIPFQDKNFDYVLAVLAAHEIRNTDERILFFKELARVANEDGRIIVTEHLRDLNNFLAYNIGSFHFLSKGTWLDTFERAGISIEKEIKITPFISTFILKKNGNTY